MSEVEDFLASVLPRLKTAGTALHNGDPRLRQRMWAHNSPVSLFGAVWTASGWPEVVVRRHGDPMPDGQSARTVARLAE
jgi:hypothetical protein